MDTPIRKSFAVIEDYKPRRSGKGLSVTASVFLLRLSLVVYLIFDVLAIYPSIDFLSEEVARGLSLAKFSHLCYFLLDNIVVIFVVKTLGTNGSRLLELIDGRRRHNWLYHIVIILIRGPVLLLQFGEAMKIFNEGRIIKALYLLGYLPKGVMGIVIWCFLLDATSVLEHRVKRLLVQLRAPSFKLDSLVKEKWIIRDQVSDLNKIFASHIMLFYMQISALGIVVIETFVIETQSLVATVNSLIRVAPMGIGYVVAVRGSKLISLLVEVERLGLLRLSQMNLCDKSLYFIGSGHNCPFLQWQVLRFDGKWDSLNVGCFVNCLQTFISFLVSYSTCVAVVMQFDYKVVWVVKTLSEQYGANNRTV